VNRNIYIGGLIAFVVGLCCCQNSSNLSYDKKFVEAIGYNISEANEHLLHREIIEIYSFEEKINQNESDKSDPIYELLAKRKQIFNIFKTNYYSVNETLQKLKDDPTINIDWINEEVSKRLKDFKQNIIEEMEGKDRKDLITYTIKLDFKQDIFFSATDTSYNKFMTSYINSSMILIHKRAKSVLMSKWAIDY